MENEIAKAKRQTKYFESSKGSPQKVWITQHYSATSMARQFSRDGAPFDVENENAKTVLQKLLSASSDSEH